MQENHKRFAEKYFETLNAKDSAIYAGFSEATAKQYGYSLLQRDDVQDYIEKLREKQGRKHNITVDRWLSELEAVGFSNIKLFVDDNHDIKTIDQVDDYDAKAISLIEKTVVDGDFGVKTTVKLKLHDKLAALDKIGRHFDFYNKDSSGKSQTTNIINLGNGVAPDEATT